MTLRVRTTIRRTAALAVLLAAALTVWTLPGGGTAAAQSRFVAPQSGAGAKSLSVPNRLSAKERAVLKRLVARLHRRSGGGGPSHDASGTLAAGPNVSEATYCCWKDGNGKWQCQKVDLLTICINSIKVHTDD